MGVSAVDTYRACGYLVRFIRFSNVKDYLVWIDMVEKANIFTGCIIEFRSKSFIIQPGYESAMGHGCILQC